MKEVEGKKANEQLKQINKYKNPDKKDFGCKQTPKNQNE